MSSSTVAPAPTHLTVIGLKFVQHMLPNSAPALSPSNTNANEAHAIIQSELYPGIVFPPAARPSMPQSEIDRLSRKIGRENTLQRALHPIPDSASAGSPLTHGEAHPQAEIDHLSRRIGRENILQRTLHPISASVVSAPATPDQRILLACRRKSYPGPSNKFVRDTTPLW
ncbi:hypothetical protein DFH08DRAFT_955737 [Mycena albidolilacea]|uniref:Uncharacterized protein n=1 Tax=Mycena albidolilacea TaxID=1033008 RepID=A0AAD7AC58_9AGAR|nr:hypothetical protein DFH08DRAFT_955737 [Mycena albidolilacea]